MRRFFKIENLRLWRKKYQKLVNVIAVLVVFATTYSLILPAITLDQDKADQTPGISAQTNSEETTENSQSIAGSPVHSSSSSQASTVDSSASDKRNPETTETDTNLSEDEDLITEPTSMSHKTDAYELTASFDETAKFPQGVELQVRELDSQSQEYQAHFEKAKETLGTASLSHARFLDISFLYKNQEIEPAAPVRIKIKNNQALQLNEESQLKIVHFVNEEDVQVIDATSKEENNQVSEVTFEADSFSVYGDVAADYYTVRFIYTNSDGNEEEITTLVDKAAGSTIGTLPEAPFKNGFVFSHWKDSETGGKVEATTPITANMTVEAVFNPINIYTIDVTYYYHNVSKDQDVTIDKETVQIEPSDTPYQITPPASTEVSSQEDTSLPADAIYYPETPILEYTAESLRALDLADGVEDHHISQSVKFVPFNAEYDFVYMLKDLTGNGYSQIQSVHARGVLGSTVTPTILTYAYADYERADTAQITEASGQKLYVYYSRKNFTLSYNSNGGTNIPQQSGLYGSQLRVSSTQPSKEGYDFAGWYDNPELSGNPVTDTITLKDNTVLYAKWNPRTVPYTIVYYKQEYDNITGTTKYVYDSAQSASGRVGTNISANNAPNITTSSKYWEKDAAENANSSAEIAPDGSSVLKVYYKLKKYTFVFDLNGPTISNSGRIRINNTTYNLATYTIPDVVLGQDISSLWPSSSNEVYDYYGVYSFDYWRESRSKTKRFEVTSDLLDLADSNNRIRQTAIWTRSTTLASVEYWLQSADDPNVYVKSDKYSQSFIRSSSLTAKDIFGYNYRQNYTPTGYQASQTTRNPYTYRFYYDREQYQIDYYYNGRRISTTGKTVPFERNINTSTYNYTPSRPSDVDDDYTWGGWHEDAGLTTPYSFSTMPSSNIVLYAKWVAPTFKVTFDTNGADSQAPETQIVDKYKYARAPADPTRDHYNFLGWYTEDGQPYNWADQVTKDTKLIARWELKPLTYTVRYLEAGTNSQLAADKVVSSPALELNQSITEKPLGITGYRPDSNSQTIQLNFDGNVITFLYTPKAKEVTYTIKYVLKDNENIEVAPSVTRTVDGSIIRAKESAAAVNKEHMRTQPGVTADMLATDYYPTENTQGLILTSDSANNVIVFKYVGYDTKTFTINYLDMDGNPIPGQEPLQAYQKKPGTYLVNHKSIEGYSYDHSKDSDGAENKVLYRVTEGGQVTIDLYYKKNLTLSALDKEKVYDGNPLISDGLADLDSSYAANLKEGDVLTAISYDGSQTDVGRSSTTPKDAVITNALGADRTAYYKISYEPASLTVHQQTVTVVIDGEELEKIYDGQEASIGYRISEIQDTSQLYKETDIQFNGMDSEKTLTEKDAGSYILNLQGKFSNSNPNFKVEFLVSNGSLIIKKRNIILTSDSATKAYDGNELTAPNITVSAPEGADYDGFVDGEGINPDFVAGQTLPGTSPNLFNYEPKQGTNLNNYEIESQFGKLTVHETVNLQKTNQDWSALSGGKFELTKWDGLNWAQVEGAQEVEINSNQGTNIPLGLEPGRYRIQEIAAPDGFVVLDSFIYFSITENFNEDESASYYTMTLTDESGNSTEPDRARLLDASGNYSHRIQVANEQGKALPHTGGSGYRFYMVAGLTLMALALVFRQLIHQKRERGLKS